MKKVTRDMYDRAKSIERLWELSEENEYYIDIWCFNDEMFRKKYGDVNVLEIIRQYEKYN